MEYTLTPLRDPPTFSARFACHFIDFPGWRDGAGHTLVADESDFRRVVWQTTRDPRDWERELRRQQRQEQQTRQGKAVVSLVSSDEEDEEEEEEPPHAPRHPPIVWTRRPDPPPFWLT